MTEKKIKLNSIKKMRSPREDRVALSSKAEELKDEHNSEFVSEEHFVKDNKISKLIKKLPEKDRFVREGMRQQSSINTSDYTNCLIDILIEKKLENGEKIKKTSYLEKYLIQGLKKELHDLGVSIK